MIYRTSPSMVEKLISIYETGMGYQIIRGRRENRNDSESFIVYNAQMIIDLDEQFLEYRNKAFSMGVARSLSDSSQINLSSGSITLVTKGMFLQDRTLSERAMRNMKQYSSYNHGAIDGPKENADGVAIFVRISAFENDLRMDEVNKRLKEGSYTTTQADYDHCVKNNADPVDRYALPSNLKIDWTFYVRPKQNDSLKMGTVQPAYGHRGGGIETFFERGTSNNTYFNKRNYGK